MKQVYKHRSKQLVALEYKILYHNDYYLRLFGKRQ